MPSFVVCLLLWSCPSAIAGLVITVNIYSVDAMFWAWLQPHILKEVIKIIPSLANRYSSPSIIMELGVIRITAPVFHTRPRFIFGRYFASCTVPVLIQCVEALFLGVAATALSGAGP
jgi:hypothetical protein